MTLGMQHVLRNKESQEEENKQRYKEETQNTTSSMTTEYQKPEEFQYIAKSRRESIFKSGVMSPSIEEHFYPFVLERQESYIGDTSAAVEEEEEDLSLVLHRKQRDLHLAAELGKALLERNEELSRRYDGLQQEFVEKMENLEQEKHELRLRLESQESLWETRVAELENDLTTVKAEFERQQNEKRDTSREKSHAVQELSEQNQRLVEQLSKASQSEQQLQTQLYALREEFHEKNLSSTEHIARLQSLQVENTLLLEQKNGLDVRVRRLMEESANRQSTIEMLQESIALLKRHQYEKELQLLQIEKELQEARTSNHQLQQKLRDVNDVIRLQEVKPSSTSLFSEIEQTDDVDSATSSQVAQHTVPSHLQMENFTDHRYPQENHAGDMQVHEEHTEHLQSVESNGESVKTFSSLTTKERDILKEKEDQIFSLQDQIALHQVEIKNWKEEVEKLQNLIQESDMDESLKQAITDRNEAIMKKNEMELEVTKSLQERESMKRQLLHTIQKKVELSQELEEWQEDMQVVINQQLKTQHEQEQQAAEESSLHRKNSRHGRSFRSKQQNSLNSDGKGFFSSLFRKS